jgi:hypothetical protein
LDQNRQQLSLADGVAFLDQQTRNTALGFRQYLDVVLGHEVGGRADVGRDIADPDLGHLDRHRSLAVLFLAFLLAVLIRGLFAVFGGGGLGVRPVGFGSYHVHRHHAYHHQDDNADQGGDQAELAAALIALRAFFVRVAHDTPHGHWPTIWFRNVEMSFRL